MPPADEAPTAVRVGAEVVVGAAVFFVAPSADGAVAFVVDVAGFAVVVLGFVVDVGVVVGFTVVAGFAGAFVVVGAVFAFVVSFFAVPACAWSAVADDPSARTQAANLKHRAVESAEFSDMITPLFDVKVCLRGN